MADTYGVAGLSESVEGTPITYHFCYQATDGISINVNWDFTSTPSNASITVYAEELDGIWLNNVELPISDASGSEQIDLPFSTFMYVKITIVGTGGTVTTYLS